MIMETTGYAPPLGVILNHGSNYIKRKGVLSVVAGACSASPGYEPAEPIKAGRVDQAGGHGPVIPPSPKD